LADELVRLKVDLIIAGGPNDGLTAKKATKTIPIIFTDSNSDPVARGLVDSLARPGGYFREDFVEQGGLMSYGADEVEPFKRVAAMVDKILKGTKPADIPVEQSTKFEFVVNLKAAKQVGVTVPPDVLARANRIIK
jgi:putative tryptophan/tyrosine transport system substrate-binding protein